VSKLHRASVVGNHPRLALSWSVRILASRQPGRAAWWPRLVFAGALGCLLALSACVRSYQPLTGLHDPVVVDPTMRNFPDMRLHVYCVPGKGLKPAQASILCQRMAVLFENQGASVQTFIEDPALGGADAGLAPGTDETARAADLVLELEVEAVLKRSHPITYAMCWFSFSIVPMVRETTFTQRVVVRDASGFLLASDRYRGRLVERFGAGVWTGNWILDKFTREPEDRLTGEAASNDLSADLYGQLTQLVFNARLRREALQLQPVVDPAGRR